MDVPGVHMQLHNTQNSKLTVLTYQSYQTIWKQFLRNNDILVFENLWYSILCLTAALSSVKVNWNPPLTNWFLLTLTKSKLFWAWLWQGRYSNYTYGKCIIMVTILTKCCYMVTLLTVSLFSLQSWKFLCFGYN